jgi:hypothetical protein
MRTLLICGILITLFSVAQAQQAASANAEPAPPPATVTGSGTTNYIPMWTGSFDFG